MLESATRAVEALFSRVPTVVLVNDDAAGADMDIGWTDDILDVVISMFIILDGAGGGTSMVVLFVTGTISGHDATLTICCCCTATAAARAAASAPRR